MTSRDGMSSVIATCADWDGVLWLHASIAHRSEMPSYEDLVQLHESVWRKRGYAYQCFVPGEDHVNLHEFALHLWGRFDGKRVLPDFGIAGTI